MPYNSSLPLVSEVLNALKEPVYVDDPTNREEVALALLEAWDQRCPAHSVETDSFQTGRDTSIIVVAVSVECRPDNPVSDDDWFHRLARSGAARLNPEDDPHEAWLLAYQRANRFWRLVAQARPADHDRWQKLLDFSAPDSLDG